MGVAMKMWGVVFNGFNEFVAFVFKF